MTLQIIEMQEHLYRCYYAVFLYSGRPRKLQVGDLYTVQLLIRIHNLYIFSMKSEEKNRNAMARGTKWRNNEIINFKIDHFTSQARNWGFKLKITKANSRHAPVTIYKNPPLPSPRWLGSSSPAHRTTSCW